MSKKNMILNIIQDLSSHGCCHVSKTILIFASIMVMKDTHHWDETKPNYHCLICNLPFHLDPYLLALQVFKLS
jgi:hypothetical protein